MVATLFEKEIAPVRPPAQSLNHRLAAIDPGLDGAIVIVEPGQVPVKFVMPVNLSKGPKRRVECDPCMGTGLQSGMKCKKCKGKGSTVRQTVQKFYSLPGIRQILVEHDVAQVYLEIQQAQQQPVPKRCKQCQAIVDVTTPQSITATFNTGRGYGALEGLLAGLQIPYTLVHPRSWQPRMLAPGKGDTKARAVLACEALFPRLDLRRSALGRKPHDGICDALLIATFGQREMMWTDPEDPDLGF